LNAASVRTTDGIGYVRPTPRIVLSLLYSTTSTFPRKMSAIASFQDATRSVRIPESRKRTGEAAEVMTGFSLSVMRHGSYGTPWGPRESNPHDPKIAG